MSLWWRMTSNATCSLSAVSWTPWYGACSTRPRSASFLSIAETDAGVTPRRAANAVVVTALSPRRASA